MAFLGPLGWYFSFSAGHGESSFFVKEERVLTAHDKLFGIHLTSEGSGWIAGKYGLILHTQDGGKNWRVQDTGTTHALTGVSFENNRHGYSVGAGGTVLTTTDGGKTWKRQEWGGDDHLLGVHAVSATRTYVVGAFGTFLSSSDGGESWKRHKFSWENLISQLIQEMGYVEPNLNAVYFATENLGWVGGEFGLILHTRDGGESWITQRYGANFPQIVSLMFQDDRQGWAVGPQGTLLRTVDGGSTWISSELDTKRDLYGISLIEKRGVIVGEGAVLQTLDGGSTWINQKSLPENLWLSAVTMNGKEAVAVGSFGTIHRFGLDNGTRSQEGGGPS